MYVKGVPVFKDINVPGAAFAGSGGASRVLNAGYRIYFVNFKYIHPFYTPGFMLQLGEWKKPLDYYRTVNHLMFQGNLITERRMAHGVMFNVDATIAPSAFTRGTITWAGNSY